MRKGLYYRAKQTALGPSVPSASGAVAYSLDAPLHPAKSSAGNALGLSTQNPARPQFATPASAAPGALQGATVHTRRPVSRFDLDASDGALLELLRDRARYSDLSPQETSRRPVSMLSERERFKRLANAALSEPSCPSHAGCARGAGRRPRCCARSVAREPQPDQQIRLRHLGRTAKRTRVAGAVRPSEHPDFAAFITAAAADAGLPETFVVEGLLDHRDSANDRHDARRAGNLQGRYQPLNGVESARSLLRGHRPLRRFPMPSLR